jgi:hypothetical protein
MLRITKFVILAALLSLVLAPAAMAQFTPHGSLGPVNPTNGFPTYVTDINGVSLDLPAPPIGNGVDAPTMIFDPVITGNALSEASGFGAEAFFFLAESSPDLPNNAGRALLVLAIEAAYGAGEPDPNAPPDQFLFARVRVRFDAAAAGTYTAIHPWGVETMEVTADDVGNRFSYTNDWGGFAPIPNVEPPVASSFERILYSPKQWRFLQAVTMAGGVDPASWIGDGVTLTTVTGGLDNINSFSIYGPSPVPPVPGDIGPLVVTSTAFTVSGHILGGVIPPPPPPTTTDTVTIERARLRNNSVEVRANSTSGFPMTAQLFAGGVNGTLVGSANLGSNGRGNITVSATPDTVRVHSTSPNPAITGGVAITPVPFP